MREGSQDHDDKLGERLGRVLRAPERLSETFEQDLVRAIRRDTPIERQPEARVRPSSDSWWRTPVPVRLSPLAGLALAASLFGIAVAGGFMARSWSGFAQPSQPVAQVVRDTVHVVRFVFVGDAKTVTLVGDFNGWQREATPLVPVSGARSWTVSVTLPRGRHEYAFIVDGQRWVADPYAPATSDDFDTSSSIVNVGT
ncbi:MAG TPA: isoamylase early set domain-containing protein [Gemmatimonadaceae bacterium]